MLPDAVLTDAVIWRTDLRYSDLTGTALAEIDASGPAAAAFVWKATLDGATLDEPPSADTAGVNGMAVPPERS